MKVVSKMRIFVSLPRFFCEQVILWFLDIPLLSGISRVPGLGSIIARAGTVHAPERSCKRLGRGGYLSITRESECYRELGGAAMTRMPEELVCAFNGVDD